MSQSIHLSQPKTDVQAVQSRNGLPTHRPGQRARARFVYVVFPKSWEYVAGFGFLPVMRSLTAKPGANGVPASGSLAKPIASAIQKGGTFIDPKDQRLGEYMDYVQFYDTQTGGKWYVDFCSKVTVLSSGELIWNTKESVLEFAAFRRHIVDAGIVPPMLPEIYDWLIARAESRATQLLTRADSSPHLLKKHDDASAIVQSMRDEWSKMNGRQLADPKKTKTPRRNKVADIMEG